jgi:hypothetical protein
MRRASDREATDSIILCIQTQRNHWAHSNSVLAHGEEYFIDSHTVNEEPFIYQIHHANATHEIQVRDVGW